MRHFLLAVPPVVLYGCAILVAAAFGMSIALFWQTWRVKARVRKLTKLLVEFGEAPPAQKRNGLSLATLEKIRSKCEKLDRVPRGWWKAIESHTEQYTSPEDVEGWFLTEQPREILPYEIVISNNFHSAIFSSFPGLLTGAGLTLTFIAILKALYGVHYDKANTVDPISGIDTLINGLSGKFLSSIVALLLSILFTLVEKSRVRGLRNRYERMIAAISGAIPYLSQARI